MSHYLVAFWNLENLFAPENDPARPEWLAEAVAKDLKGWTQALFDKKVSQLASIIAQMKGGAGPDLLGVCEVENEFALKAVATELNGRLTRRPRGSKRSPRWSITASRKARSALACRRETPRRT